MHLNFFLCQNIEVFKDTPEDRKQGYQTPFFLPNVFKGTILYNITTGCTCSLDFPHHSCGLVNSAEVLELVPVNSKDKEFWGLLNIFEIHIAVVSQKVSSEVEGEMPCFKEKIIHLF